MKIETIAHEYRSHRTDIMTVWDCAFFREVDRNGSPGASFPFCGIQSSGHIVQYLGIRTVSGLPECLYQKFSLFHEDSPFYRKFPNFHSLLISAWLGGGAWNTEEGKELKTYLEGTCSSFFLMMQTPEFTQPKQIYKGPEEVHSINQWICHRLKVEGTSALPSKLVALPEQFPLIKDVRGITSEFLLSKVSALLNLPKMVRSAAISNMNPHIQFARKRRLMRSVASQLPQVEDIQHSPVGFDAAPTVLTLRKSKLELSLPRLHPSEESECLDPCRLQRSMAILDMEPYLKEIRAERLNKSMSSTLLDVTKVQNSHPERESRGRSFLPLNTFLSLKRSASAALPQLHNVQQEEILGLQATFLPLRKRKLSASASLPILNVLDRPLVKRASERLRSPCQVRLSRTE